MIFNLMSDYKKFERIAKHYKGNNILNLSNESFLAPTTVIPLLCFIRQNNIQNIILNNDISWYMEKILNKEETTTTLPYQILPYSVKERNNENLSTKMAERIENKWGSEFGGSFH